MSNGVLSLIFPDLNGKRNHSINPGKTIVVGEVTYYIEV